MSLEDTRAAHAAIAAAITDSQAAVLADFAVADAYLASVEADAIAREVSAAGAEKPVGAADSERTYSYNFAGYTVSRADAAIAAIKAANHATAAVAAAYAAHTSAVRAYDQAIEAIERASSEDADLDPSYLNAAIEGAIQALRLRHAPSRGGK
jgi:hypothetical protein